MDQEVLTPCIIGKVYRGSVHRHPELDTGQRLVHLVFTIGTSLRYSRFFILSSLRVTIDEYSTTTRDKIIFRENIYAVYEHEHIFIGYAQSDAGVNNPTSTTVDFKKLESDYLGQEPAHLILVENFENFVT